MATRKWGSEAVVNSRTAGDQFEAEVAALADGGYVVVWEDYATSSIQAQRFNADGVRVGAQITVAQTAGVTYQLPSVTALADGGFYVAYTRDVGPDNDIEGKVYGANGSLVRDQVVVYAFGNDTDVDLASLGTGSVAAWYDPDAQHVLMRIFDGAGSGGTLITASVTGGIFRAPSVDASPDAKHIVAAWQSTGGLYGRVFDPAGSETAAEFRIDVPNGTVRAWDPKVAWLNDEQFAVVWYEANPYFRAGNEVKVRIFDGQSATAVPLTGVISVNGIMAGGQSNPAIAALPTGGFVVSWADYSGVGVDNEGSAIRLQVFDGAGGKVGGEIVVNTSTAGYQIDPSVAGLADGRIIVTWTDSSGSVGDGSGNAIRSQIIDPRDGIVTGSSGNDVLRGHDAINDEMSGGAGNDTMYGLNGDDLFYGGAGNDVMVGGKGDDWMDGGSGIDAASYAGLQAGVTVSLALSGEQNTGAGGYDTLISIENLIGTAYADKLTGNSAANGLNGGGGADVMAGGAGNDTYYVDNTADKVIEASGGGTDLVRATVSYSLASQVENLTLVGIANINATGNSLANAIQGNAGNNIINGLGGIDRMQGLGGNDRYYVDNSADVIVEGLTEGTADRVYTSTHYSLRSGVGVEILSTTNAAGTAAINLAGNSYANTIIGNAGNNFINGAAGADRLTGLGGNDIFMFNTALGASNVDVITDFNVANDTIRLENAIFTKLATAGTLNTAFFKANTTGQATDSNDYIVYETDTGKLFYDADGSGAGAAIQFATLTDHPALTAGDFLVV